MENNIPIDFERLFKIYRGFWTKNPKIKFEIETEIFAI